MDVLGGLSSQRDLAAINAEDTRVSTWRAASCDNCMAGNKTEFHQAVRNILRKVDVIQQSGFVLRQIGKAQATPVAAFSIETQLHLKYTFSIVPQPCVRQFQRNRGGRLV